MTDPVDNKKRLHWDPTVSAGNVLTAACLVATLIFWGARLEGRVDRAEDRQSRFEAAATQQRNEDRAYEAAVFLELRGSLRRIEDILLRPTPEQRR